MARQADGAAVMLPFVVWHLVTPADSQGGIVMCPVPKRVSSPMAHLICTDMNLSPCKSLHTLLTVE